MINVNGHNDRQMYNGQAQGGVNADASGNVHVSAVRPGGSVTSSDASKLVTDIRNLMPRNMRRTRRKNFKSIC